MKIESILKLVSQAFQVDEDLILSQSRKEYVVIARHTAMSFMRDYTDLKLQQIAAEFNRRDHSTVLYAIETLKDRMRHDKALMAKVGWIRAILVRENMTTKTVLRPALKARLEFGKCGRFLGRVNRMA